MSKTHAGWTLAALVLTVGAAVIWKPAPEGGHRPSGDQDRRMVAGQPTAADFDRELRALHALPSGPLRRSEIRRLFQRMRETTPPEELVASSEAITDADIRLAIQQESAEWFAQRDLTLAFAFLSGLPEERFEDDRNPGSLLLPHLTGGLTTELESLLELPQENARRWLAHLVVERQLTSDAGAVLDLPLPDDAGVRLGMRDAIVESELLPPATKAEWISRHPDVEIGQHAMARVASEWAARDGAAAMEWLIQPEYGADPHTVEVAFSQWVREALAEDSLEGVVAWLELAPAEPVMESALLMGYIQGLSADHPDTARANLHLLPENRRQTAALLIDSAKPVTVLHPDFAPVQP